jgi:general secretion pathway protein K
LDPPYRAANQLLKSPDELLAIKGVTPAIYEALRPYVTALPTTSAKINLNTAPLPVLESIADAETGGWQSFIAERMSDPLTSLQDATKRHLFPKAFDPSPYADVSTAFFQLQVKIIVGTTQLLLYSTIERTPGATAPTVILRSFGAD